MRTSQSEIIDRKVITMALVSLVMFVAIQSKASAQTSSILTETPALSSSQDLMCRNQAKEVAAQIYKDCVVQTRQAELERIKQEYKDELNRLRNKYNQEIQSLKSPTPSASLNKSENSSENTASKKLTQTTSKGATKNRTPETNKKTAKNSTKKAAKNTKISTKNSESLIPATAHSEEVVKSQPTGSQVRVQTIDFTTPEISTNESQTDTASLANSGADAETTEIIEIPVQQE